MKEDLVVVAQPKKRGILNGALWGRGDLKVFEFESEGSYSRLSKASESAAESVMFAVPYPGAEHLQPAVRWLVGLQALGYL